LPDKISSVLQNSSTMLPDPAFNDTRLAFAYKKDQELKKARFLFSGMGNQWLLRVGLAMIPPFIRWKVPFVKSLVRNTIFSQFVGGESLQETIPTVEKLAAYGVHTILDYGVEGKEDNEQAYEKAAQEFVNVIRFAAGSKHIPFISIKLTGLVRSSLLEKLDGLMSVSGWPLMERYSRALERLSATDQSQWMKALKRLKNICQEAAQNRVGVWLDAEESWLQEPMDAAAMLLMQEFNVTRPVLYNTYQLYRHDRLEFLKTCHLYARQNGFILGAKIVRGAYMEKERMRASASGYPSPIQPDKDTCDRDYDMAVQYCIDNIEGIAVALGTHNEKSSLLGVQLMKQKGLQADHPHVCFAQLLGMSDNITFNLAAAGYRAGKYLPYGPIEDVIPYLMRRAEENSSVKGQTGRELSLIRAELKRRKSS
jgi:proline dehydrogenase